MPPARFAPGTKSPSTPSDYTDAQWAALEKVKHTSPKLKLGAAKKQFINQVMLADGRVVKDLAVVRKAAATVPATEPGNLAELEAMLAQKRFLIIVDVDHIPRIYFQAYTGRDRKTGKPLNPDLEYAE